LTLSLLSAAYAQDARETLKSGANDAPAQKTNADEIQEVIVTANKREETLSKVGLTVTALSGEQLAERGVTSLQDIASIVPGLSFTASSTNTPVLTLRGVGFNDNSLGIYPAVSVYMDQAPLPFPVYGIHSAYDLERIEVLKGPQGTLFGENATGGAINYIAAKPTDTFEAASALTLGRFNEVEGNAYVTGPITDTLRGRVAVSANHTDGWQISSSRRGDTNGALSYLAGRVLLDWDAASYAHFHLNFNGWNDTSEPQAPQLISIRGQQPPLQPQELLAPLSPANTDRVADWSTGDNRPRSSRQFYQAALRADFDLPAGLTLTSLTSYEHYTQKLVVDSDGSALQLNDLAYDDGDLSSFNQEVRVQDSGRSAFRWVVGANYEHSLTEENQDLAYRDDSVVQASNLFIDTSGEADSQAFRNYALFANGEFSLTPQLVLKGGVRYTKTKDGNNNCGYAPDHTVADLFNLLGGLLGKVPFTPIVPSNGPSYNNCYSLNGNQVPGFPYLATLEQSNVSWRGGIDYQLTDETLLYANASRGFKAGSFPSLAAATYVQLAPVTQEELTAFEAGVKVDFWERRIRLAAAGFYYDYKNKQVRGKEGDPVFGILDIEVNIPKSRVYGVEEELTVRPTRNFTFNVNATFLKSDIQRYTGFNVLGHTQSFAGDPLPFTPKWNYGLNADYRFAGPADSSPFVGISVDGHSSADAALGAGGVVIPADANTRVVPGIARPFELNSYSTVAARVGYEAADGRWKVMLWGKNIFNKYYWNNVVIANDSVFRLTGMPATYGITFSSRF
jgi:outer membrane receptor protein involved in Fe transport